MAGTGGVLLKNYPPHGRGVQSVCGWRQPLLPSGCRWFLQGPVVLVKKCEGANTGLSDSIPPVALRFRSRGVGLGWLWAVAAASLIVSAGRMQAPQQASLVTGCFYWTAYRYGILCHVPGGTGPAWRRFWRCSWAVGSVCFWWWFWWSTISLISKF